MFAPSINVDLEKLKGEEEAKPVDRKVMWLRASGERWKTVCWKVGLQRAAAHEHWLYALCVIAWRLNGHHLPKGISKRRFIEKSISSAEMVTR